MEKRKSLLPFSNLDRCSAYKQMSRGKRQRGGEQEEIAEIDDAVRDATGSDQFMKVRLVLVTSELVGSLGLFTRER